MTDGVFEIVRGGDLCIGDTIETWWAPRRDTVTHFERYDGPLARLWPAGARIAYFALCRGGMTVGNDDDVRRLVVGHRGEASCQT